MKQRNLYLIGFLVLLNLAIVSSLFNIWWWEETLDTRNIRHESGFAYAYTLRMRPTVSDDLDRPTASYLAIYEDGVLLGPAHSLHRAIRDDGQGRYSHWEHHKLAFSSSDNSNPVTNGRDYTIQYPLRASALLLVLTIPLLVSSVMGLTFTFNRLMLPTVFVLIGLALILVPFEIFLRSDYAKLHAIGAFGQFPDHLLPTLNAKGYRDTEHDVVKPPDRFRILILGDSMTFGHGLRDDDMYPRLLAGLAGPRVEIITLAQNGWSTADQLLALRREGLAYQPDLVVVGVVTNDPGPLSTEPSGQQAQWVVIRRLPFDLQAWRFFDYHINRIGDILKLRYTYSQWEDDIYDHSKRYRGPWEKAVRELSDELRRRKIPGYAFILIGPAGSISEGQTRKYDTLYHVFSDAGFKTTNLQNAYLKEFEGVPERALWVLPDDAHPGPRINRFFAREMWEVLQPEVHRLLDSVPTHMNRKRSTRRALAHLPTG